VAMRVLFTTSTHEIGDSQRRAGELVRKPIEVGKGCWIGAGAVILPGIVIGDGCVIGAGAVVNRDCDPNGLYVGVPARRIRELEP
jgi:maltose O-acetyltransferase